MAKPKAKKPTRTKKAVKEAKGPCGSYLYTQKMADEICERLADGESVNSISKTEGFPSPQTVYRWALDSTHSFADSYARAREAGYLKLADEILEISDDATNDFMQRKAKDGETILAVDHDHIARSRLRVDSRKWLLSKMLPKVYGDKVQHSGEGGGPLKIHMIPGDAAL